MSYKKLKDPSYIDEYEFNINDVDVLDEGILDLAKQVYSTVKLSFKYMFHRVFYSMYRDVTEGSQASEETKSFLYFFNISMTKKEKIGKKDFIILKNLVDLLLYHGKIRKDDPKLKMDPRVFGQLLALRKLMTSNPEIFYYKNTKRSINNTKRLILEGSKEEIIAVFTKSSLITQTITFLSLVISNYFSSRKLLFNKMLYKNTESFTEDLYRIPSKADLDSIIASPSYELLKKIIDEINKGSFPIKMLMQEDSSLITSNDDILNERLNQLNKKKSGEIINEELILSGTALAVIGGLIAAVFLATKLASIYLRLRIDLSSYLEQQSKFLELNALNLQLEDSDLNKKEIEDIRKKQLDYAESLMRYSDMVKVDNKKIIKETSKEMKKELDKEKKEDDKSFSSLGSSEEDDNVFF